MSNEAQRLEDVWSLKSSRQHKLMMDVVEAVRPFAKKQLFIEGYESEFRRVVDALAALDAFEASK